MEGHPAYSVLEVLMSEVYALARESYLESGPDLRALEAELAEHEAGVEALMEYGGYSRKDAEVVLAFSDAEYEDEENRALEAAANPGPRAYGALAD